MRVLHVLPVDIARGAQVFAQDAVDALNLSREDRHELAVLFRSGPTVLRADHRLDVPSVWRDRGLLDPRAVRRLDRIVRRLRPDIVVAHGGEVVKYAAAARTQRRANVVGHAIGVMPDHALRGPAVLVWRRLFRVCDEVVAVSSDVASQLRDYRLATNVRVVPNGRRPPPEPPSMHVPTRPRVAFVGHLTASKRPHRFLDVIAEVRRGGVDCGAVMIGDGPQLEGVRARGERDGVIVLGRREDVGDQLRDADVLLFTSLPSGEGMPGVLIEAGLAGLPVVSTGVPGVRDVVVDGQTGFVVPVDDLRAMTDATARLLAEPALRARLGRAAYDRCRRDFSLDASVSQWRDVLHAVGGLSHEGTSAADRG